MKHLEHEIHHLKERNRRVDADKAWETSWQRKLTIAILTYVIVVIFLMTIDAPKPFLNALVPTAGFLLSTLTLYGFKRLWIRYGYKNEK
ncbi:MAG: hypothetical protein ABIH21_04790 [Patescibacteria group bacterium]